MRRITIVLLFASLLLAISSQNIVILNPGCREFAPGGTCKTCSVRYYKDKEGICQPVNPNCDKYDELKGSCITCYPGFTLVETTCLPSGLFQQSFDPNCNQFNGTVCVKCSFRFYTNAQGRCMAVNPNCAQYNDKNGDCTGCYPGFIVSGRDCIPRPPEQAPANCFNFSNGVCQECSVGFYFDENRICRQIPDTCANFNKKTRICEGCFSGYQLDQKNQCVKANPADIDPGCNAFDALGNCKSCSIGFYFNQFRRCVAKPANCEKFNEQTQTCLGCYLGYQLNASNDCVRAVDAIDQGCSTFKNGKCVMCSFGYDFDSQGVCRMRNPNCASFDNLTKICTSCYNGFALDKNNQCVVANSTDIDPNCKSFVGKECVECSVGSFKGQNGKCITANPLCKNFSVFSGQCTECYTGFELVNGNCNLQPAKNIDPYCKTFVNNQCTECSFRYYKGANGLCQAVDPSCSTYIIANGLCTGCYTGFKLQNNKCVEDLNSVSDPNCAEWQNNLCLRCAPNTFRNEVGICKVVDPQCKTFNNVTGLCVSCYTAFYLSNGKCIQDLNYSRGDAFCANFSNGVCVTCSFRYYLSPDGTCKPINPLCNAYDGNNGRCLTCYLGFALINGDCIKQNITSDEANCAVYQNNRCTKCSEGYYFNQQNVCTAFNPYCKTSNKVNGKCTECYVGFVLVNDNCIVDDKKVTDPYCAQWQNSICLKCANRAYFNDAGLCMPVSEKCKTFNQYDGSCLSCYPGFSLQGRECIKDARADEGCSTFDPVSGQCTKCGATYYLDFGRCVKIDDLCSVFNINTKTCEQCYSGYNLVLGKCVVQKIEESAKIENCFAYDINGRCSKCFDRYYLSNNACKEVDVFCKDYNESNGNCTSCYSGFNLNKGTCSLLR